MRAEKYEVLSGLSQSKSVFLLTGYIPQDKTEVLEEALAGRYDAFVEFSSPESGDEVPVLLHNNAFAEPAEGIVESYSLPAKGELDPTAIMAPFYYLLFGLMLSDAAYGLIMVFGCLYIMKKYLAEMIGTMVLVIMGCGSAVFAGSIAGTVGAGVGTLGVALAFGLAVVAMAYTIGGISGCHINPAITLGVYLSGRMSGKDAGNFAGLAIGPAIFEGGTALRQLWLFIVAPFVGAVLSAGVWKLLSYEKEK